MTGVAQAYRAHGSSIEWRQWADDLVVYDNATAQTHLLAAVHADILLTLLTDGARTIDEIARGFQFAEPIADTPLNAEELSSIERVVQGLVQLGLVEKIPL